MQPNNDELPSTTNSSGVIINVMDFDIDEEQEKEERELESYRQNANQRLFELKQKNSGLNSLNVSKLPKSAPGLGGVSLSPSSSSSSLNSSSSSNFTINNNSSIQQSKTSYTSKIISRTPFNNVVTPPPSSSSPSSSSNNTPSSSFVPQKFIPPPRTLSQNSQNSQKNSPSVVTSSLPSSFVTPVKAPSSYQSIAHSTNTPPHVLIPPFSSSGSGSYGSNGGNSPQVVASSSGSVLPDSYVPFPTSATTIVANEVQKKNPIVKHIRDKVFKLHFTKDWTLTDYILGRQTTAFYLSLKFHMTKPKYILERIKNFHKTDICKRGTFINRIILVNVDVHVDSCGDSSIYLSNQDSQESSTTFKAPTYVSETALDEALIEVTRISMWADWTVICGFSDEECALYLETIRACESKSASLIQGPNQTIASLQASVNSLVTSTGGGQGKRKGNRRWSRESSHGNNSKQPVEVEKLSHTEEVHQLFASSLKNTLNKRDHITLLNHFGSLKEVIQTTTDELNDLPGFGKKKVKKLINLFQTPFIPGKEASEVVTKKTTKKQSNIKLVKKSILQDDDDDDLFIINTQTGKEEKVNCKLKVSRKQSEISAFFSQKPKSEEEDSD